MSGVESGCPLQYFSCQQMILVLTAFERLSLQTQQFFHEGVIMEVFQAFEILMLHLAQSGN